MPPEKPLSMSKNENDIKKLKKHKTLNEWTCQVAMLLRRWVKRPKKITIIADSAFSTYILANTCIDLGIIFISRIRLDARIFEFPENPKKGCKKLTGKRLPSFKMMLKDRSLILEIIEVL